MKGDAFVVASITVLVVLVSIFVFYPVGSMFIGAFQASTGRSIPMGS
jgi:iron(III) transport system permease protein